MPILVRRLFLVVLFCAVSARAQADPILYNLTGQIREVGTGTLWNLTGSFLLSDPTVITNMYNDSPDCGCMTDLVSYSLTNLTMESALFSASGGTGLFTLKSNPVYATDRFFYLHIGGMDSDRDINFVGFNNEYLSNVYSQPDSVQFANSLLFGLGPGETQGRTADPRYQLSLSAQRVPEPSGLALIALGGLGIAVRRLRSRRAPSR